MITASSRVIRVIRMIGYDRLKLMEAFEYVLLALCVRSRSPRDLVCYGTDRHTSGITNGYRQAAM